MPGDNDKATEALTETSVDVPSLPGCVVWVADGVPGDRGRHVALHNGRLRVGSADVCDLQLSDAKTSREHVELAVTREGIAVRDLGSKNGTRYQGHKIERAVLNPGARLVVGKTVLVLLPLSTGAGIEPSEKAAYFQLLGQSLAMRRLFAILERVEMSEAPVLITGETGTGKDMVARAIHGASPRKSFPFLIADCGAVAQGLIDSEIFGHVRGAFTGAVSDRAGVFEQAHGGTVFLDEIAELPLELQPRLLRVLESGSIKRVGDSHLRAADVRVIAATHRDLRAAVEAQQFREDLYYRLAVLEIRVPALRERRDDIPLLARHLASQIRDEATDLPASVLNSMGEHDWPGNVRELRNAVQRLLSLGTLELADTHPATSTTAEVDPSMQYKTAREQVVQRFEAAYVRALIEEHDGNISAAARAAGIRRNHFRDLLRKHGLYNK